MGASPPQKKTPPNFSLHLQPPEGAAPSHPVVLATGEDAAEPAPGCPLRLWGGHPHPKNSPWNGTRGSPARRRGECSAPGTVASLSAHGLCPLVPLSPGAGAVFQAGGAQEHQLVNYQQATWPLSHHHGALLGHEQRGWGAPAGAGGYGVDNVSSCPWVWGEGLRSAPAATLCKRRNFAQT